MNNIFRLANHLQLFSKFCALSWKDVFTVTDDILATVKNQDPEYYNHLKSALGEKILPIDVYDFTYEILHKVFLLQLLHVHTLLGTGNDTLNSFAFP